jgi:hypothetical protein
MRKRRKRERQCGEKGVRKEIGERREERGERRPRAL